jgi:hypothetical protein
VPASRFSRGWPLWLIDHCFFYRLGKLIRAGSPLTAALEPFELGDKLFAIHSLNQRGDGLQISIAAIPKGNRMDLSPIQGKENAGRTGSFGFILNHDVLLGNFIFK